MKRFFYLIFALLIGASLVSWDGHSSRLMKKFHKVIQKNWEIENLTFQKVTTDSLFKNFEEVVLYKVGHNDTTLGYALLKKSFGCRVGGCAVYSEGKEDKVGNYDPFYYAMITDETGIIQKIKVLEFHSDYGYQITQKRWLRQFSQTLGINLKYERDIDAISGATISVKAMIDDVDATCRTLQEII